MEFQGGGAYKVLLIKKACMSMFIFSKCFFQCILPGGKVWGNPTINFDVTTKYLGKEKSVMIGFHCVKSVQIQTRKNSVFGHFSRSVEAGKE